MSTFFTLSGFLIGRGLFEEHLRSGAVSLRSFWSRRLRRLMPAALAAIALITVAAIWLADATQWIRLRGDALSSLAYVANWHFIAAGDQYGATFASPSPFTHFWTLSIEEQFYIFAPVILVAVLSVTRGSRRWVGITVGGLIAASVLWSNWLVHSGATIDRLYFGTEVRMAELFAGVALALWWTRRPDPLGPRGRRAAELAGPVALVAMLALWATADLNDLIFYRGGLLAYSVLTLIMIVASMQPGGIITRILGWRPLVWVGIVSYAAYLLHYPILIWLRQHTELGTSARLVIAVVVTFSVAALSGKYLERPIRAGSISGNRRVAFVGIASVALTVALILVTTAVIKPHDATDLADAERWQRYLQLSEEQRSSDAPRLSFYGDSTAVMTARGVSEVSLLQPEEFVAIEGWARLGCGLNTAALRRVLGADVEVPPTCLDWVSEWESASIEHPADVAVVQLGPWEVTDQQLEPDGPFLSIEDPELAEAFETELRRGLDVLLEHNGMVVLLVPPDIEMGRNGGRSPDAPAVESDPARMQQVRDLLERVATTTEGVHLVDLASWVEEQPDDAALRPDGVHFTDETAKTAARWLGPELAGRFTEVTGETTTQVPRS